MKKTKKILSLFICLCMMLSLLPSSMVIEANAQTTVNNWNEFVNALNGNATTINLGADISQPNADVAGDNAFLINKAVTINGNNRTLSIGSGGIILGGNVNFNNIKIGFSNPVRNAIIANGHTLTLNGVTKAANSAYSIHLFAGGITDYNGTNINEVTAMATGNHGQVIISGVSDLGNIYAGSLSDGANEATATPNNFSSNSTITIESDSTGTIGNIFASGARESRGEGNPDEFINNSTNYKVSGDVKVVLKHPAIIQSINGSTGGTKNAAVEFNHALNDYPQPLTLNNISSLSVKDGHFQPNTGSSLDNNADITIEAGAQLDISNLNNALSVGNFTGGGSLVVNANQTLTINGTVSGQTNVGIGGINSAVNPNQSTGTPKEGHTYITITGNTNGNEFTFLQNNNFPDRTPKYDTANKGWAAPGVDNTILISNININNFVADITNTGIEIPIDVTYKKQPDDYIGVSYVPLTILKDGFTATRSGDADNGYTYSTGSSTKDVNLEIVLYEDNNGGVKEFLNITGINQTIPEGTYNFTIQVPKEYMENNTMKQITFTITVQDKNAPTPTKIAVPTAVQGLTYNGNEQIGVQEGIGYTLTGHKATDAGTYTATATLAENHQWNDGTTGVKTIAWTIAKANGSGSVTLEGWTEGEAAKAPVPTSATNGTTNVTYQYKLKNATDDQYTSFTTPPTTAGEYTLKATFAETNNYLSASAQTDFTIKAAPVLQSISVTKQPTLEYNDGAQLNLSAMEITASYSDGSSKTLRHDSQGVTASIANGTALSKQSHDSKTIEVKFEGKTANTNALNVKSTNTNIASIAINNTNGTINGDNITVVLPANTMSLPNNATAIKITPSDADATASIPTTTDNGATWTFTVTAESGVSKSYTIKVSIAADEAADNKASVSVAKSVIEKHNWTVSQIVANDEATVKSWIEGELAKLNLNNSIYSVTMNVGNFVAALQGSEANVNGTNGSFEFTVDLSKGVGNNLAKDVITITSGIITAESYNPPAFVPVTSITGVPSSASVDTPLTLIGTVAPNNATNKSITWTIEDAGTTGASLNGNMLTAISSGVINVKATIKNGKTPNTDYSQIFTININDNNQPIAYTINVMAEPALGGTVTGGGSYNENQPVTVEAIPNIGYKFVKWIENGLQISTEPQITFTASSDRNLTAVFELEQTNTLNLKLNINDNFTDADIPQELKNAGFNTVEKIESAMKAEIGQLENNNTYVIYDLMLMVNLNDGNGWVKADTNHFPADGKIKVSIPVPEGTDPAKHDYTVIHMFGSSDFGKTPGTFEHPKVTERTDEFGNHYIEFYVTGLSPIMVSWTEASTTASPVTFDQSYAILLAVIFAISGASTISIFFLKKKNIVK